jgi:hypothetical protein
MIKHFIITPSLKPIAESNPLIQIPSHTGKSKPLEKYQNTLTFYDGTIEGVVDNGRIHFKVKPNVYNPLYEATYLGRILNIDFLFGNLREKGYKVTVNPNGLVATKRRFLRDYKCIEVNNTEKGVQVVYKGDLKAGIPLIREIESYTLLV